MAASYSPFVIGLDSLGIRWQNGRLFNDFFLALSQHFGQSWGGATNQVATAEELAAMNAFFSGGGTSGVPEPGSLGLLVVGGSALLLRRRRGLRR